MSNIIWEGEDKLDLDSGYFTRKAFTENSDESFAYQETVTELVKETKKVINGRDWYVTTITLPAGILFPDGKPDNYEWVVAPVVNISEGDKGKYPIPGQEGETYNTRVGIEDAKKFKKFKEAVVYLGML